ncbi:Non-hem dioxygenase N-terminal domain - like 10 [Theobroma cacao]|nr:Non-hem dioxygenase N-terminal domain - like 10 [Theobroma cacao]
MESRADAEVVNFGKSIIVPSVQELAKEPITKIPHRYLRPEQEPHSVLGDELLPSVPIIDLQKLVAGDFVDSELERLHSACKDWGFFQLHYCHCFVWRLEFYVVNVVNHGVGSSLLEEFRLEIENFFNLPHEEKKLLWQQPDNHEGFGQLFVVSEEQKLDWSDMFYITTLPHNLRKTDLFEKLPLKLSKSPIGLVRDPGSIFYGSQKSGYDNFSLHGQGLRDGC